MNIGMKNRWLLLGVLCVALAGCANKRTLVGKWDVQLPQMQSSVAEFKPDGNLVISGTVQGGYALEMTSTYKVDGETFSQTMTDIKLKGDVNPMVQSMLEAQTKELKGKESKAKMIWNSDDEVVFEPLNADPKNPMAAVSMTLKRKKE